MKPQAFLRIFAGALPPGNVAGLSDRLAEDVHRIPPAACYIITCF